MSGPTSESAETALITGAAGGLGQVLVATFLAAGYRVAAGWHESPLAGTGVCSSDRLLPVRVDVALPESVEAAVAAVGERWGGIDVLVNNAGVTADASFWQMSPEQWEKVLATNLKGAFCCCRACAVGMCERGRGHMINIASHAGRTGARGQANYAAAKAGLIGLTQSLAAELGPSGVQVNAVLPGVLRTRMTDSLPQEVLTGLRKANVLGRFGEAAEVARYVAFLAGMRHVSGQVFVLDGRPLRTW